MTPIPFAQGSAAGQIALTDALPRFGEGTDAGDAAMLASAFAHDAVSDFGACGCRLDIAPLHGRAAIVAFLAGNAVGLVTSHVVSDARVAVAGDHARLSALVEAVHINRYEADFSSAAVDDDGSGGEIERLATDNVWYEGDPRTMLERGPA